MIGKPATGHSREPTCHNVRGHRSPLPDRTPAAPARSHWRSYHPETHNKPLKNMEQKTKQQFPCVTAHSRSTSVIPSQPPSFPLNLRHSRGSGNPTKSTGYWIPAFVGMMSPLGSEYDETFFQPPKHSIKPGRFNKRNENVVQQSCRARKFFSENIL